MDVIILDHWEILVFFFIIALFYSSVGFGGGSSYLAILALYGTEFLTLRSTALLCNIAVVAGSVLLYSRQGLIEWKPTAPLVALSVPAAFLGGILPIREVSFFILLGAVLLVTAIVMWIQPQIERARGFHTAAKPVFNGTVGGGIGFLSGMVGIGGGIFLSPVLHLIRWTQPKSIAATAALFILVNSIAGLVGQSLRPGFAFDWSLALPLIAVVITGGQIGARIGMFRYSQRSVKRATAVLIFLVSVRILWKYLG